MRRGRDDPPAPRAHGQSTLTFARFAGGRRSQCTRETARTSADDPVPAVRSVLMRAASVPASVPVPVRRADRRREIVRSGCWSPACCACSGCTARVWNLDFDQRQHLHPDERFWATDVRRAATHPRAAPSTRTLLGPVLDWLDGQRSPANPYRVTESFVYGPVPLTAGASGLRAGCTTAWSTATNPPCDRPRTRCLSGCR